MAPLGRPPVMLDIVEEHFEELDFLWELREGVIFAPDWNLTELAELEERAEAHLDGLRLAELHAVDVARPHLMGKHTFAATAATFVLMESHEAELAAEVMSAFSSADAPARDGIRIGLRHSEIGAIAERLLELAGSGQPGVRAAAADVLAFHRRALPEARDLLKLDDDAVQILTYGALGRSKTPLDPALVNEGMRAKTAAVRRAALEAAARSGTPGLDTICLGAATRAADPDSEALAFLGVLGDSRSAALLRDSLGRPDLARAALRGLGALGRSESIPLLLETIENPDLAAAAGAAFQRITGAEDIAGERPKPPPAGAADLEAEFADDTPAPDPAKARAWWQPRQAAFKPPGPWQAGVDVSAGVQPPVFHTLPLGVRRDLYLRARAARGAAVRDFELERRAALQLKD